MSQPQASAIVLTLHGVQCDANPVGFPSDRAARRYTIGQRRLERLLGGLNPQCCCTVREFVGKSAGDFRILTFDDGLISDFVTVFPRLLSHGVRGTFFVTAEHVGRDGFTSLPQLKKMADADMEIGSHGLTHRCLVTMPHYLASVGNGNSQSFGLESTPERGGFHAQDTTKLWIRPEGSHPEEVFG